MGRKNRLIMTCSVLIILSACIAKDDISFKKVTEISVDSDVNTCSLVESVNGKKVTKFDWDGDRIVVEDDAIVCPVLDTHEMGKKTLIFTYRNGEYPLEINIIDDIKPVMGYKSNELILNISDREKDLLQKLDISDEHSAIEKLFVEGKINYDQAGKYPVKIHAEDESGNVLEKEITVIIQKEEKTEKQKETKPNEETETGNHQQKYTEQQNDVPPQQNQGNGQNHQNAATAENKMFLFSEGYDYDSCYQAGISYAKEMVAQGKANGYTCTPIKDGKEYIGYQVIFK